MAFLFNARGRNKSKKTPTESTSAVMLADSDASLYCPDFNKVAAENNMNIKSGKPRDIPYNQTRQNVCNTRPRQNIYTLLEYPGVNGFTALSDEQQKQVMQAIDKDELPVILQKVAGAGANGPAVAQKMQEVAEELAHSGGRRRRRKKSKRRRRSTKKKRRRRRTKKRRKKRSRRRRRR